MIVNISIYLPDTLPLEDAIGYGRGSFLLSDIVQFKCWI